MYIILLIIKGFKVLLSELYRSLSKYTSWDWPLVISTHLKDGGDHQLTQLTSDIIIFVTSKARVI